MDEQRHSDEDTQEGEEDSLPLAQPSPADRPLEPAAPSPVVQKDIAAQSRAAQPQNAQAGNDEPFPVRVVNDPLPTRVVKDDELGKFENATLTYARWGFGIAAISLIVVVGTAILFWDQFREMSAQTDLLERAARQARKDSADASVVTAKQLALAQQQADAAQNSVKAIQGQTYQMQRPWIAVDVRISQPLIFGPNGTSSGINVAMSNVGHSVAKYTSVWSALVVDGVDSVKGEQDRICGIPKFHNNRDDYGSLIFPGQTPVTEFQPIIALPQKIVEASKKGIADGSFNRSGRVAFHVVVCVDYVAAFDARHHQTRNMFLLGYPEHRGDSIFQMGAFDIHTTYDQLILTPTQHGASAD